MRLNQRIDPNQNEGLVKAAQLYSAVRDEFVRHKAYLSSLAFMPTQMTQQFNPLSHSHKKEAVERIKRKTLSVTNFEATASYVN